MNHPSLAAIRYMFCIGLAVLSFLISPASHAATLSSADITGLPGDLVAIPVTLAPNAGEQVAGLQFDLLFDPRVLALRSIDAGAAATQAGKLVSSNPVGNGKQRVIVAGLNQTAIPAGEIVRVAFSLDSQTAPGKYPLTASGLVLSDPAGKRLPGDVAIGAVIVTGDAAPVAKPKQQGCGCAAGGETRQADMITFGIGAWLLAVWPARRRGRP